MAEFGALAAKTGTDMAKDLVKEVQKALETTFTGNRNLDLKFPTSAVSPIEATRELYRAYNFTYALDRTYTYTAGYYSHVRATLSTHKKHEIDAMRAYVRENNTDGKKSTKSQVEAMMVERATQTMRDKYMEKYVTQWQASLKRPTHPAPFERWLAVKNRDHRLGLDTRTIATDTTHKFTALDFGKAMAASIVTNNKEKLQKAVDAEFEKRAHELISYKDLGKSPEAVENKVRGLVSEDVRTSAMRSVQVAYEVTYRVMKIDAADVARRFDILESGLVKERSTARESHNFSDEHRQKALRQVNKTLRELRAEKKAGGDWGPAEDEQLAATREEFTLLTKRAKEQSQELDKRLADLDARSKRLVEEKAAIDELVQTKRFIAGIQVRPVSQCGGVKTGIRFRNTNASLKVTVYLKPDQTFAINFDWQEESKTAVPWIGDKLLSNIYSDIGSIRFGKEGYIGGDGKFGERFDEVYQEEAVDASGADVRASSVPQPSAGPTASTPGSSAPGRSASAAQVGPASAPFPPGLIAALKVVGREPVAVEGSGNRFFDVVVAAAANGGSSPFASSTELRHRVAELVQELGTSPHLRLRFRVPEFETKLPENRTFETLGGEIRTTGRWVEAICLPVAAVAMGRAIHIHTSGGPATVEGESGSPIHVGLDGGVFIASRNTTPASS